ncbi:hypothetical protein [Brevibacillus sp. SYSU BS000544]|uniref:hypothetical protein n=1 Tax=Brevibacillus sp. SYSU BS000544 TaxID=3416443 RepID=UPI003CE52F8C
MKPSQLQITQNHEGTAGEAPSWFFCDQREAAKIFFCAFQMNVVKVEVITRKKIEKGEYK